MTSDPLAQSGPASELAPWVIVICQASPGGQDQLAVWRLAAEQIPSAPASATLVSSSHQPSLESLRAELPVNSDESKLDAQYALALFSDKVVAERYAKQYCTERKGALRVEQFQSLQLVAVLAECYRCGMRYAALNPGGTTAQQVFVLRDVLAAVKRRLHDTGSL